ncbi:cdc42 effector protein 3 [Parambassis ranga]|uniref:Cdc42 effector protein 3 n=1 Tax=Parambassis ranga TaxID=210632 RepID=A0A6P7JQU9_9TELE|nr:cdc42 effector protein 3 [Parambassis ranga]
MPAKAPIYLKPTNNKKGKKCRLRDILSPDMISPPLGDFRHTIHIGRGGERDAFGDMSFLQGKYELLPGKGDVHPQYGIQSEFLRAHSTGDASFAETPSPVLKNAISLPTIGGCQALTLPLISSAVFAVPPEPLEDIIGPKVSMKPDEEVEILQMDALLRSMDVFSSEPSSPITDKQSKPDVLLDLLENKDKPTSKAVAKANKINKSDSRFDKPSSCYINGHSSSIYKANGSLNSNTSSDSFDSYSGKGDFQGKIYNGSGSLNGNGNCNGYGHFNNDINLGFKQELSKHNGEWVDRDSGMEEGRICDFEFEFSKEKSTSQDSLGQITGSFLSLELDLGPSILDDVLNIMDKPAVKSRP